MASKLVFCPRVWLIYLWLALDQTAWSILSFYVQRRQNKKNTLLFFDISSSSKRKWRWPLTILKSRRLLDTFRLWSFRESDLLIELFKKKLNPFYSSWLIRLLLELKPRQISWLSFVPIKRTLARLCATARRRGRCAGRTDELTPPFANYVKKPNNEMVTSESRNGGLAKLVIN